MSHIRFKHREYPWEPVATSGNHSDHSIAWTKTLSKAKSCSQRPQKNRVEQVHIVPWFQAAQRVYQISLHQPLSHSSWREK